MIKIKTPQINATESVDGSTATITVEPLEKGLGTTLEYWNQLNANHYAATSVDILQPVQPAFTAMQYADGQDAAIAYKQGRESVFVMGFPFECIKERQKRVSIMQGILNYLLNN